MIRVLTRCSGNTVPLYRLNQSGGSRPQCHITHLEACDLVKAGDAIVINRGTAIRLIAEELQLRDQSCKMGPWVIQKNAEGFTWAQKLVAGWEHNHRGIGAEMA